MIECAKHRGHSSHRGPWPPGHPLQPPLPRPSMCYWVWHEHTRWQVTGNDVTTWRHSDSPAFLPEVDHRAL